MTYRMALSALRLSSATLCAGVHTYTQAVSTAAGQRTRVRASPFSSREEADKAAAALKRAGLPSAVQAQ